MYIASGLRWPDVPFLWVAFCQSTFTLFWEILLESKYINLFQNLTFWKSKIIELERILKRGKKPVKLLSYESKQCKFNLKNTLALTGVAQWIECWPVNQTVSGSIASQGTWLGCGPGPQ